MPTMVGQGDKQHTQGTRNAPPADTFGSPAGTMTKMQDVAGPITAKQKKLCKNKKGNHPPPGGKQLLGMLTGANSEKMLSRLTAENI